MPQRSNDHRAWLDYWATHLVAAIADAVAHPPSGEDFRLNYAVHCARIAHYRAIKLRPRLRQP